MVGERGEPFLSIQPCSCPYTVQSRGHAGPARVRRVLVCPVFSSAPPLRSTRSGSGRPSPFAGFPAVGSEEAPIEGLASVRRSNGTCSFPAFRFHEWLREIRREGISETRLILCPPESGPSSSDLRTSNDRIVSSKRDVRVFHKGNFPSSRSFLIYLDRSKFDPL